MNNPLVTLDHLDDLLRAVRNDAEPIITYAPRHWHNGHVLALTAHLIDRRLLALPRAERDGLRADINREERNP